MKHTTGEWTYFQSHDDGLSISAKETDGVEYHPIIGITNHLLEEEEANAKLMASAPELLKALKDVLKGEGAYDMEPIRHANNTIESMKSIAKEAIEKGEL